MGLGCAASQVPIGRAALMDPQTRVADIWLEHPSDDATLSCVWQASVPLDPTTGQPTVRVRPGVDPSLLRLHDTEWGDRIPLCPEAVRARTLAAAREERRAVVLGATELGLEAWAATLPGFVVVEVGAIQVPTDAWRPGPPRCVLDAGLGRSSSPAPPGRIRLVVSRAAAYQLEREPAIEWVPTTSIVMPGPACHRPAPLDAPSVQRP
jgi:hypothetical protein